MSLLRDFLDQQLAKRQHATSEKENSTVSDLDLIADLPGDTPWPEARRIMAERKKAATITATVIDDLIATATAVADALAGLTFSEIPEEDGWTPDRLQDLHKAAVELAAATIPVRK